jgi:hypothetical protein
MERCFSLVRLTPIDDSCQPAIISTVQRSIRELDAEWQVGNEIYVMLSETSAIGVGALMTRLHRPGLPAFRWAAVEYPKDGLTVQALISGLQGDSEFAVPHAQVSDRGAA